MPKFLVTVFYREPTYEQRVGDKAEPYRWTYRIAASTDRLAERAALAEFRRVASRSGSGWIRRVVRVDVRSDQPLA